MKNKLVLGGTFLLVTAIVGASLTSHTSTPEPDTMSPAEIYARCYAKLVRRPVASDNPILVKIRKGTLQEAEKACGDLIDSVLFTEKNSIANPEDREARAVLTTFQLLHNSWFQAPTIAMRQAVLESKLIHDVDEPGLFWTRALFKPNTRADSVITYDKAIKSIRVRSNDGGITHFQARSFFNYPYSSAILTAAGLGNRDPLLKIHFMNDIKLAPKDGNNYSAIEVPDSNISQFGEMIGIEDQSPLIIKRMIIPSTGDTATNTLLRDPAKGPNLDIDLHRNFGGGILGSIVYGLKNSNLGINQLANSYSLIDRRFASRIFQDLLCYQLPVLQPEDIEDADIIPDSVFPFQQNKSCMQCHATIDEFAMIQKNYVWVTSSGTNTNFTVEAPPKGTEAVTRFQLPTSPATKIFALGEPKGTLRFRNFSGQKIRIPISSFAQVGAELAKQEDFYLCAAKRYYQYFTGVDVPLGEAPADALANAHLLTVKNLGYQLKKDQNLRHLIKTIFESEAFQSRNYKTKGVAQ